MYASGRVVRQYQPGTPRPYTITLNEGQQSWQKAAWRRGGAPGRQQSIGYNERLINANANTLLLTSPESQTRRHRRTERRTSGQTGAGGAGRQDVDRTSHSIRPADAQRISALTKTERVRRLHASRGAGRGGGHAASSHHHFLPPPLTILQTGYRHYGGSAWKP